ncbi:MAG TPA: DUF4178 domain-containing protein [Chloroflexia bacterium]|nr:DUF4178 domain-containing protein [Chloroflexia bacterium]
MSLEVRQFNCPNCGAPLDIQNLGRSKSLVCPICHSQIDLTQPPYQIIGNVGNRPAPLGSPFQLGMQGTLGGETYQIIGRVRYQDDGDLWDEWLLLSTQGAYRWLSDSTDVGLVLWSPFSPPAPINPTTIARGMALDLGGPPARVRSQGAAVIAYLEGELTWRATLGDRMQYAEAVGAGGQMYSVEWTESEVEFYAGQALDRRMVESAFGLASAPALATSGAGRRPGGGCFGRAGVLILILVVVIVLCFVVSVLPSSGYSSGSSGSSSGFSSGPSIRSGSSGSRSFSGGGSGGGGK